MSDKPRNDSQGFEKDEQGIHQLFALLREEAVGVSARFRAQVKRTIDDVGPRHGRASASGLFASVLVESLNMVVGWLGGQHTDDTSNSDEEPL